MDHLLSMEKEKGLRNKSEQVQETKKKQESRIIKNRCEEIELVKVVNSI